MAFKLISLWAVACILSQTAASIAEPVANEYIAALYVKDDSNGELRFLTGSGLGTGGNINAQLNQYITQQQNLLEQLRPTTAWLSSGTGISSSGLGSSTGIYSGSGVTPIVTNANGSSSSTNVVINNSSPNSAALPQIIGQAVTQRRGPNNNRRRVNQRRRNNRRRGNKKPHIYVVRPRP